MFLLALIRVGSVAPVGLVGFGVRLGRASAGTLELSIPTRAHGQWSGSKANGVPSSML